MLKTIGATAAAVVALTLTPAAHAEDEIPPVETVVEEATPQPIIPPRVQVRIMGRCKSWDVRITVRQPADGVTTATRNADLEITVNDRDSWFDSTMSPGDIQTFHGESERNRRAKTIRVYEDGDLVQERTFPCGDRRYYS